MAGEGRCEGRYSGDGGSSGDGGGGVVSMSAVMAVVMVRRGGGWWKRKRQQAVGGGERGRSCFWALALAFPVDGGAKNSRRDDLCSLVQRCADPPPDHATHTAANAPANFSGV